MIIKPDHNGLIKSSFAIGDNCCQKITFILIVARFLRFAAIKEDDPDKFTKRFEMPQKKLISGIHNKLLRQITGF